MLKMLVMHWGQPKMEANLLYGVLVLVQKARPQDRSDHMEVLELAMRSPQKKERSMQSFTEKRVEHMTEVIANLLERHGSKYILQFNMRLDLRKSSIWDLCAIHVMHIFSSSGQKL